MWAWHFFQKYYIKTILTTPILWTAAFLIKIKYVYLNIDAYSFNQSCLTPIANQVYQKNVQTFSCLQWTNQTKIIEIAKHKCE